MSSDRSVYTVLGLDERADIEEIKQAYRYLVKRHHPDSSGNPASARQFARVMKAYKVLTTRVSNLPARGTFASLRAVGGDDIFALGSIVVSDSDASKREAAVRALGLSGKRSAYVFIRKAFYDDKEPVVIQAVRAIALLGIRQAEGELASLYARASRTLRDAILETARWTREPVFKAALAAAAADPAEPETARLRAARALEDMDIP